MLLKQAVIECYNTGYWGFTLGTGQNKRKFNFEHWENMCSTISSKMWNAEIIMMANGCFRFWNEPAHKINGIFHKTPRNN